MQAIRRQRPSTRIIAIVSGDPSANVGDLIRAGARGALTVEEAGGEELVQAVEAVPGGAVWLSPKLAGRVLDSTLKAQLTARETEVLALVARGLKNAEIAERLTLSKYTVQNHVAAIYDKLGVRDRAEAILYAVQLGLVEVDGSLFRNHEELPWA
ncbi:MAG: response regulator transcription factor [Chloroflexota bacterium]